jgi:hypothetical protein
MTTTTLPHVAADLDGSGHAFYAARLIAGDPDAENIIWFPRPVIPAGLEKLYRWADDAEIGTEHLCLDVYVTAQLLAHDLSVNPDVLTAEDAATIIDRELYRVGCDMYRCCLEIYADEADHPNASQRWDRCVLAAGRLCGVSV